MHYLPQRIQRGLRPQPKVAITLPHEHLSLDIHQQKQGSVVSRQSSVNRKKKQAACSRLKTDDCKLKTPFMWPSSRLFTAERDGYFAICQSPRPNRSEDEVYAREQRLFEKFRSRLAEKYAAEKCRPQLEDLLRFIFLPSIFLLHVFLRE